MRIYTGLKIEVASGLGMVMYACNLSFWGGGGPDLRPALAKVATLYLKNTSQVWSFMPIIPTTQEAEVGKITA
jgi:hypothetical protein